MSIARSPQLDGELGVSRSDHRSRRGVNVATVTPGVQVYYEASGSLRTDTYQNQPNLKYNAIERPTGALQINAHDAEGHLIRSETYAAGKWTKYREVL